MASSSANSPVAVCVVGMHRSGTSALTRLLNLLGVDLGRTLLDPSDDNPKGFWENREIVDCHSDLLNAFGSYLDDFISLPDGWETRPEAAPFRERLLKILRSDFAQSRLWGFKDPRTCRLLPLWHELLKENGNDGRFILMVRHPAEVHASLARRSGYPVNKSMLVTLTHVLEAERQTRGHKRVAVTYDQVMFDWMGTVGRIGKTLEIQWPNAPESVAGQFSQFLDPALRHHRSQAPAPILDGDADFSRWAMKAYEVIASAAESGGKIDQAALDAVGEEFRGAQDRYLPWRPVWSMEEKFGREIKWNEKITGDVERLNRELAAVGGSAAEARERAAAAESAFAEARKQTAAAESAVAEARQRTATTEAMAEATTAEIRQRAMAAEAAAAEATERALAAESMATAATELARLAKLRFAEAEDRVVEANARAVVAESRKAQAEARAATAETKAQRAEAKADEAQWHAADSELQAAIAKAHADGGGGRPGFFGRLMGKA